VGEALYVAGPDSGSPAPAARCVVWATLKDGWSLMRFAPDPRPRKLSATPRPLAGCSASVRSWPAGLLEWVGVKWQSTRLYPPPGAGYRGADC